MELCITCFDRFGFGLIFGMAIMVLFILLKEYQFSKNKTTEDEK